jgi:dTMP kinase
VVICDRYADSSIAYQGYGGGVPLEDVRAINRMATGGLVPDRTVLFDLPVEAGLLRRATGAVSDFTRFESTEQHDLAFHQRVRAGYLAMAASEPDRWRVINSDQPADTVAKALWEAVRDLVGA